MITVKLYGRYYNVDCKEGESANSALERAVATKKLGKPFSGPVAAKEDLPKIEKVEDGGSTKKIKAKKSRKSSR